MYLTCFSSPRCSARSRTSECSEGVGVLDGRGTPSKTKERERLAPTARGMMRCSTYELTAAGIMSRHTTSAATTAQYWPAGIAEPIRKMGVVPSAAQGPPHHVHRQMNDGITC
jgi:hypothetical protein